MGLIDYRSRNPVGLAIPPSEYDEKIVVASNNAFINNLESNDNVILNQLANHNKAPYELIKKRAKHKALLDAGSNTTSATKHSKHSTSGQLQPHNQIQFHSKNAHKQSVLSHSKNLKNQLNCKNSVNAVSTFTIEENKMSRKEETKAFKGRFFPQN